MTELLAMALRYTPLGWPIFPATTPGPGGTCDCYRGADCEAPGKHARIKGWQELAATSPGPLREWWGQWPEANIGLPTGRRSLLAVLDVDPRHHGDKTLAAINASTALDLRTVCSRTGGGGWQFFYRMPEGEKLTNSAGALGDGLDVRGVGGLVILPPSLHYSGNRYRWAKAAAPWEAAIKPFPPALIELWHKHRAEHRAGNAGVPEQLPEKIRSGQRNNIMTSLAGTLHRRLCVPAEIEEMLAVVNRRCVPPLQREELQAIVASVVQRPHDGLPHAATVPPVWEVYAA